MHDSSAMTIIRGSLVEGYKPVKGWPPEGSLTRTKQNPTPQRRTVPRVRATDLIPPTFNVNRNDVVNLVL